MVRNSEGMLDARPESDLDLNRVELERKEHARRKKLVEEADDRFWKEAERKKNAVAEEKERLMEKQREVNEEEKAKIKQKEVLAASKEAAGGDPDRGLPRKPPQMKGKIGKQM